MAKFPSIQSVLNTTKKTICRFPLETIITLFGTVFAILLSEIEYDVNQDLRELYTKAIMSCSLCLVLFLSVSLYFEARSKNTWIRFFSSLLLGGLITAFVFNFSVKITEVEIMQFLALNIAIHLLVSFAGFLPKTYLQEEFWEFNKQLFIRILASGLYSGVLYVGLALAITAVTNLFNVTFYDTIYAHLFFTIAGVFNTIFFLTGVPETNNKNIPLTLSYPKGLKSFTQYVLLPLISLYLVILICYETKILATLSLPVGWVSYLVLVFAIFGILSFLLVHPIANEAGNLWMRTFNRWFYYLLIPLLGLLFWAILYRIHLYGFTHERYYVLSLSIWLTLVVVYFLIQKQPKIKFIPISLCLTALFTIIGPQSADTVSKKSQLSRFETYLQKPKTEKLTFEQEQDLSSIVGFLEKNYGVAILLPYTNDRLKTLLKKDKDPNSSQIMEALGYEYRSSYESRNDTDFYYNFYEDNNGVIQNIHGYDMSFSISKNTALDCKDCLKIATKTYSIKSSEKEYGVDLQINQDIIPLRIVDFVNKNKVFGRNDNSNERVTQKIETSKYTVLIQYITVSGKKENGKKTIKEYQIKVLVGIKS